MNLLRFPFGLSSLLARAFLLVAAGGVPAALPAQSYTFSTLAGTPGVSGEGDNTAQLFAPLGLGSDSAGNIYFAETFLGLIRKITSAGVVTNFAGATVPAGSPGGLLNQDGTGSAAFFVGPYAVAVDGVGNVYVANGDVGGAPEDQIRKITSGGVVTTLRTVPARLASLAVDGAGIVYFIFEGGNGIYKFGTIGGPTLLAGGIGAGSAGYADGTGTNARFDRPSSIAVDQAGNVYVTDTNNHAIRKITSAGVVTTVAGQAGTQGNADGTGTAARFNRPTGLAIDSTGSLYVFDGSNYTVRKITSGGVVTTLAGLALASGSTNGIGNAARFSGLTLAGQEPTNNNLTVDGAGNVYVADLFTATIRKITSSGVVTTLAGTTGLAAATNRPTLAPALFNAPGGAAVDRAGNIYVADSRNRAIRRITSDGAVTTLKADTVFGTGITDFSLPSGVAVDSADSVYVADRETHTILKISYSYPAGGQGAIGLAVSVSTLAGSTGTTGFTDGQGAAARFNAPSGVAVDDAGNVYVADANNHTIRKITNGGAVTTLAGLAGSPGASNGTGDAARFSSPFGVAVDKTGNIYVADTFNHTIRKITSGGAVTTLAGLAGSGGIADGTGAAARFNLPSGVAIDSAGNVFVTDSASDTIRKVTSAGVVTTIAGDGNAPSGSVDGVGTAARFNFPFGVAEYEGTLFVVDANNHTLRKGVLGTPPTFTSAAIAAGTVGVSFNYAATYSGTPANTFGASGLPPGLLSNVGSGVISGIPNTAGTFSVHLGGSNSAGTGSGTVVITIAPAAEFAPVITVQPLTQSATVGSNVTFSVSATSTSSLTYQWIKDSVVLSGATTSSLVLTASAGSAGNYSVVVTNSGGSVLSAVAVLTVTGPSTVAPSISLQPQSQVVAAGNRVTFTITATGTPTPTYQWRKDGNAITGATASSLVLSATTSSDTASYTVVVTNSAGSVTSAAAVLAVTAPVPVAPTITTQPQSQVVPAGTSVTLSVVATGTPAPTYQWRKDGNSIPGATASSLVLSSTTSSDTASYTVVMTNSAGSVTSAAAVLAVTAPVPVAPTITTQPQSRVVPVGTSVTLSVVATGTPTPTYQWRKDGNSIPGATASSLLLMAVSTSSVGIYSVVATNSAGSVTSAAASLTVTTGGYTFSTLAGTAGRAGSRNGTGSAALFYFPWGVAVDAAGNVYVSEYDGSTIRKITSGGVVTTFAGSAVETGASDGTGAQARFNHPAGVAVDSAGNVYVADSYNHSIRKITAGGVVTTFAGSAAAAGSTDGVGTAARFSIPMDVAVDGNGNVYVADRETHTIRKITSNGVVTTLAGQPGIRGAINGIGSSARFSSPSGVVVGRSGRVYVADTGNHTIRMIDTDGTVSTIGGTTGSPGSADANGNNARFNSPYGVAVDRNDDLLVADTDNHTIRSFYGIEVSTLSGIAGSPGSADGPGSTARFNLPRGITMDQAGNLYVADYQNQTIRKGVPTVLNLPISAPVVTQSAAANGVVTLSIDSGGSSGSSYQWFRDGVAMPGATGSSLSLDVNAVGYPGSYTVAATNNAGSATSVPVVLKVTAVGPSSALSNLSVRTTMANGQVLIVGAVVNGGAKTILIRAGGPALNTFGLTGMVDPRLELYTTAPLPVATNDDWPATLASTFSALGAFPFSPGSKDAALSQVLDGAFTVLARGTGPGTILVEAYDVTGGVSPRLVNLSARSLVGTGNDILIAGFNLTGTGTKQVLIRAVGPGLAAFGVPGTLVDPKLQVFSSSGTVLAANDNWEAALALAFAKVGAFALPSASRDAALLVTLDAGSSYTVQVAGADGGTGEALIEVYEIF